MRNLTTLQKAFKLGGLNSFSFEFLNFCQMSNFLFKKHITWILLIFIGGAGSGCALYPVFPDDSSVIAVVNNYNIDIDTFQKKLGDIHKRNPMAQPQGGVRAIDIQDVIEDMINDRLIIQEAYRVALDEDPLLRKRVNRHIVNRSVLRLRKEEVQDKIGVTEEELLEHFNVYYKGTKVKLEDVKKRIRKKLLKGKEAKRSNDYVAELKSKADIWIDTELLYSLDPWAKDCDASIIIARLNEKTLNACDLMEEARQRLSGRRSCKQNTEELKKLNQEMLDSLITYEVIEQEALKRNYMDDPLFKKGVEKYKGNLLINLFKQKMILPRAIPTKEELKEYYETHKDKFKKDYEVWFSEMTFSNPDAAEAVLKELKQGADFEFLASKESLSTPRAGVNVWRPLGRLPIVMREGIKDLEVGEVSDTIKDSRKYKVIKLKGKRGGEIEEFSRVAVRVRQIVAKRKFNTWLQEYLKELRNVSSVYINKKLLNELTKRYTKETS